MSEAQTKAETAEAETKPRTTKAEVIVVASGKGGTGKTLLTASLGYALAHAGHKVLFIDTDMGTNGLSLCLLGPGGSKEMSRGEEMSSFIHLVRRSEGGPALQVVPVYRAEHDEMEHELILSSRELYGDHFPEDGDAAESPLDRATFRRGAARLFDEARALDYDYILVDTRGGFGFESTDLCALADSYVLVTEANYTNIYQDRNFSRWVQETAKQISTEPYLRSVVINKATDGDEVDYRRAIREDLRIDENRVHVIPADLDAMRCYRNQLIPFVAAPGSRYAITALEAFSLMMQTVTSPWPSARKKKWNALVKKVEEAYQARSLAEEKEREQKRQMHKRLRLVSHALVLLSVVLLVVVSFQWSAAADERKTAEVQTNVQDQRNQVLASTRELIETDQDLVKIRNQKGELEAESAGLQEKLLALEFQKKEESNVKERVLLEAQIIELKRRQADIEAKLELARAEARKAEEHRIRVAAQLESAEKRLGELGELIKRQSADYDKAKARADQLSQENVEILRRNAELLKTIQTASDSARAMNSKLQVCEGDLARVQAQHDALYRKAPTSVIESLMPQQQKAPIVRPSDQK